IGFTSQSDEDELSEAKLSKRASKLLGERALEDALFPRDRMPEDERRGVKEMAIEVLEPLTAIELIADERMTKRGEMNAHLMAPGAPRADLKIGAFTAELA